MKTPLQKSKSRFQVQFTAPKLMESTTNRPYTRSIPAGYPLYVRIAQVYVGHAARMATVAKR
jgi:hypothetical protein